MSQAKAESIMTMLMLIIRDTMATVKDGYYYFNYNVGEESVQVRVSEDLFNTYYKKKNSMK